MAEISVEMITNPTVKLVQGCALALCQRLGTLLAPISMASWGHCWFQGLLQAVHVQGLGICSYVVMPV